MRWERVMKMQKKQRIDFRYVLVMLGTLLFFCGSLFFYTMGHRGQEIQLQQLQTRIDDLNVSIANQKKLNDEKDINIVYSTTGIDGSRVQSDTWAIESLCDVAFTWSDYADYINSRNTLLEDYDIPEDSYFMTTFFPEMTPYESNGETVNDIDKLSINCLFEEVEVYLSGMENDTYSYIFFVQFSSRSENDFEAVSTAVMMCDADANHNLSNIRAFVAY